MSFTIGSLFDGSGGFPLAATMCGGIPKWASEVEPYPIAVTKSRFPDVKHLGSVTDIKGGEVEPVDVITFGSPCQDLSVAGKRAGLKHEANGDDETTRSGLFMEAVRIIKEMREATNGVYPRFAVWENVPGAFSSNKGEDFRIVLEELIKVVEPTAVMPAVPEKGWPYADSYCGDGWSIAYRVLDAQFWGVPQRRRRIYLVADFRGECAGKVSFEREGLRGYFETGRTPWQTVTGNAEAGSGAADSQGIDGYNSTLTGDKSSTLGVNCGMSTGRNGVVYSINHQGGNVEQIIEDKTGTLTADMNSSGNNKLSVAYGISSYESNSMKSSNPHSGIYEATTSRTLDLNGGNPACNQGGIAIVEPVTFEPGIAAREGGHIYEGVSGTLRANAGDNQMAVAHMILDDQGGSQISVREDGKSPTLRAETHGNLPCVMERQPVYCLQANGIDRADTNGCNGKGVTEDVAYTLNTIDRHAVAFQTYQKVTGPLMVNSHPGSYTGQDAFSDMLVAGKKEEPVVLDRAFFNQGENAKFDPAFYTDGTVPTLIARGPSEVCCGVDCRNATEYPEMTGALQADSSHNLNSNNVVRIQYIVRRLTPTECARLQGFPDTWGHPNWIDDNTKGEVAEFWRWVYLTDCSIHGKKPKPRIADKQSGWEVAVIRWYNGLHTDSSEYKMWGNGIALPNALYVMQGIADVMSEEKTARRKWLSDLLGDCL